MAQDGDGDEQTQGIRLGANKKNICSRASTFLAFPVVLHKVADKFLKIAVLYLLRRQHIYCENAVFERPHTMLIVHHYFALG